MSEAKNQQPNIQLVQLDDKLFIPGAIISNTVRDSNSNSEERNKGQKNKIISKNHNFSTSTLTLNMSPTHRYDRNSHAQFLFATQSKYYKNLWQVQLLITNLCWAKSFLSLQRKTCHS